MALFYCSAAILAVTVIYLFWRSYREGLRNRENRMRDRVAYMLWVMAGGEEMPPAVPSGMHRRLTSRSL